MRILVIEEDDGIRRSMCRYLRGRGFEVTEATGAQDGMMRVHLCPPDLAIVDLMTADLEGCDLVTNLDAAHPDLPVVALSIDLHGRDVLQVADQLGAAAVVPKPFALDQLLVVVDQVLARRRETTTGPNWASTPTVRAPAKPLLFCRSSTEI